MGDRSNIAWTTSTFNPWIGCTKVGPGCDLCYAAAWDVRFDDGKHWGPGAPRRLTTRANWNKPIRWQRDRRKAIDAGLRPGPHRVFCASLADVFDNEIEPAWRTDLWTLIANCPDLEWQIVTKRVGNVAKMLPAGGQMADNVILVATIVNQDEADRDMPKLITLRASDAAAQVGVSYEPALGPIDWSRWLRDLCPNCLRADCVPTIRSDGADVFSHCGKFVQRSPTPLIDWIIIGGESSQGGAEARRFDLAWARSTIRQCREAGVPVFMKQTGSNPVGWLAEQPPEHVVPPAVHDRAGADPDEWPADLRVREFPRMEGRS